MDDAGAPSADGGRDVDAAVQPRVDGRDGGSGVADDPLARSLANTMPEYVLGSARDFLRIDLRRTAERDVSVAALTRVRLTVRPMPSLALDYVVLARAGERVVAALPVGFPTSALGMGTAGNGTRTHDVVSLSDSAASVFLEFDPTVDNVGIVTPDEQPVVTISARELASAALSEPDDPRRGAQAGSRVGLNLQALRTSELAMRYPHISFLGSGDDGMLPSSLLQGSTVVNPSDDMSDVIAEALAAAAPGLLSGVQRVAWVKWPDGSTLDREQYAYTASSQIIVNASLVNDSEIVPAILHEVAHAFTYLSNSVANNNKTNLALWPESARDAAQQIIARYRLVQGLQQTWAELHRSGVTARLASEYRGAAWEQINDSDANLVGFATAYGSKAADEDLAEYVGTTELPTNTYPGICPVFERNPQIGPQNAIPYAKLTLLRGVGAITDRRFGECVSGISITRKSGFEFPGVATFSNNSFARTQSIHGLPVFDILAEGPKSYSVLIQIDLKSSTESPLGLHRFDSAGVFTDNETGLILVNTDDGAYNRWGRSGLVLITEASGERTEGIVFGLVLANILGLETDAFPLTPFRIP